MIAVSLQHQHSRFDGDGPCDGAECGGDDGATGAKEGEAAKVKPNFKSTNVTSSCKRSWW
jgi:hypothetical protein